MERGIVSMRVGLSYDLLRLSPCSGDLYTANCAGVSRNRNSLAPPIHQPTNHQTTTATTTHKHNTKQIYTLQELLKGHKVTKILFVSSVLCVSVCVIYINIYTFSRGASSLLAWLQFTSNVLLEWFDKSNSMLVYYLYFVYCYLLVFVCIIAIYTYIPYILTRRPKLFYWLDRVIKTRSILRRCNYFYILLTKKRKLLFLQLKAPIQLLRMHLQYRKRYSNFNL